MNVKFHFVEIACFVRVMADKQECNTDDSSELTDQPLDEDDPKQEEKTDDEDIEEVSDYNSSDDEVEDNLSLAEQLEIEKCNFRGAKLRIANLITQVTEYQVSNRAWRGVHSNLLTARDGPKQTRARDEDKGSNYRTRSICMLK
jgi:hypothetical protein